MSRTTKSRTRIRALGALAAAAALGLTLLGISTPASAATVAPVGTGLAQEIRNQHSTLCLDDYALNTQPGAEVRQWTCAESTNQLWSVRDLGNGYAEIKNRFSNLCLDDFNWATNPGAEVRQWTCSGANVQQWSIRDVGGGFSEITNRHSSLCLDNERFGQADGATVVQWTCNGNTAQRWRLTDPSVQKITYTLQRAQNPTADQTDAYARIKDAMDRAVARYNRLTNIDRHLTVSYTPGVPTAEASIDGAIRFGEDRSYMQEGTALHEMGHTVGIGTSDRFWSNCQSGTWPSALPLLRSWDGPSATLNCGGSHMWPYGLNYSSEYGELNFDRHVKLVQAMLGDGM